MIVCSAFETSRCPVGAGAYATVIWEASKPARDRSQIASLAFFKSVNKATTISETSGTTLVEFISIVVHLSILRCVSRRLGDSQAAHLVPLPSASRKLM